MIASQLRTLALAAVSGLALTASTANATTTINVGVAANFTYTMTALVAAFKSAYPGTNVTFVSDSSGNLFNAIVNHTATYDLFLSADFTRPNNLYTTYPTLVSGSPFRYAIGSLELWSKTVNISSGLPAPIPTPIVIALPTAAPYGLAASQVLGQAPWNIPVFPDTALNVYTSPNMGTTYQAINAGTYQYGFIAQSYICKQSGGTKTFSPGYHHSYVYNVSPTYTQIQQYGIAIANASRTAAQNTELTNFISFISTNTTGRNVITSYCYQ